MKSPKVSPAALDRYGMIEPLESRIAPAAVAAPAPGLFSKIKPSQYITASAGGSIKLRAGDLLTTGANGSGIYLLYVEQGSVLVHTTDLNHNQQLDFNEITGLSVGNGTKIDCFVDIHGDVVTDLKPNFTLTDSDNNAANGADGRVLLDANIASITLRSITASDFTVGAGQSAASLVNAHLALSNYSIFGNIYAGGGLGVAGDTTSGLHIDTSGQAAQQAKYAFSDGDVYLAVQPVIGSIFVGSAASAQPFSFGTTGQASDTFGTLVPFTPAPGEAGASIYNVASTAAFNIGELHAGNGGFNGAGGSIVNVALQGDKSGAYALVAGNAGTGTTGHAGGSITNFSETGATTGQVLLQAGNGGTALTGGGGNGGAITFNPKIPTAVNAHFVIKLGNGGNGYTAGGNGTGLATGHFTTPEGALTNANNLVATMHTPGSIGTTQSFDFDGDGYSDAVFSTKKPDQLKVIFGTSNFGEFGFDTSKTIYLNGPTNVSSIVVADFNGDGHPDIAVSSGDASYAGIETFTSQYNAEGVFLGFSTASYVSLPDLTAAGLTYTAVPITKMVAGDFNGDGISDLAVVAKETDFPDGNEVSTLIYLNGDGHGHFFPDFSEVTPANFGSEAIAPYTFLGINNDSTKIILKATALTSFVPGAGHDVLIEALQGDKFASVYDNTLEKSGAGFSKFLSTISFGKVDTDRTIAKNSYTDAQVLDLVVTEDVSTPTRADVVLTTKAPAQFLVTEQGDGQGHFTITSGNSTDQAGTKLDEHVSPVGLVAIPNLTQTAYSDVAILDYTTDPTKYDVQVLAINFAVDSTLNQNVGTAGTSWYVTSLQSQNTQFVAFDTYNPEPVADPNNLHSGPYQYGFVAGVPVQNPADFRDQFFDVLQPVSPGSLFGGSDFGPSFKDAGYFVTAGNGGSALNGHGGHGGTIGQSLQVATTDGLTTATGTFSIVYPADITYEGQTLLTAGNGGNGFSGGGGGGDVVGVSVVYNAGSSLLTGVVSATGGQGGQSLRGTGGAGGSLSQLNIETAGAFIGGNGGGGKIGGNGGSVIGTKIPGLITLEANALAQYGSVAATGGNGGTGLNKGGDGGDVDSFQVYFPPVDGGQGGILIFTGGDGGNAVAGHAGSGGSVLNSSPSTGGGTTATSNNFFTGDIELIGGDGGSGRFGGAGGAISNFVNSQTIAQQPASIYVVGGKGGQATTGKGGAGGGITNFAASSTGLGLELPLTYDRVVAGEGGNSFAGAGGAGGSITNLNGTAAAADAEFFVAAGRGGDGLTAGGTGGSVLSTTVNAGATTGKVVVVAGDGGNSSSVKIVNPANPKDTVYSVGNVNGPGGNGGSIINFTQPGSIGTHVDLIAGNGGATLAHSAAAGQVATDNPGKGGSILGASIAGDIGNVAPDVAIKSYNDFFGGQTMQQFIDDYVIGDYSAPLNDSVGNVGLVAGAAGRVLGNLPAQNGINGSVNNISAQHIMSMVAGSVDQVDFIQKLTNYTALPGGYGADKTISEFGYSASAGALDYVTAGGVHTNTPLPGGGILIDGAFVAKNIRNIQSDRDFQGTLTE